MRTCECNESFGNTGKAGCLPLFRKISGVFLVPTYDSTGALNSITVSTTIDDAFLTARLNDTDASKRWRPIMDLKNVTSDRPDPTYETAPDNSKAFVQDGVRTVTAEVWNQGPEFKQVLDAAVCVPMSIYVIDKDGNLRGIVDADSETLLFPIKTDQNSWNTKLIMATDTTIEKLLMTFDWAQSEDDALLRMIAASDMTADLLGARGLLTMNLTVGAITTTTVALTITTDYGSLKSKIGDSGLVVADFVSTVGGATGKLRNNTDSADITISSVTETAGGNFALVFTPAQTSADVLAIKIVKNGRDYSGINETTFVIP